jgi:transposase
VETLSNTRDSETITVNKKEYEKRVSDYERLLSDYDLLKQDLAQLKRMIFGSKSERFIPSESGQISLFSDITKEDVQVETQEISYSRAKPKKKEIPVRAVLPAHLPRVEEVIEPENLQEDAKKIGEEVTEILEYTPGNIFVRKIIRPKYATTHNEESSVVIGDLPTLPIPRGNAGPGLLSHLQVSKWVDHLPFYRQIQIFKRGGVELSKSTLNGWFNATADLLEPLYDCLVKEIKSQDYLQADESPIKVQDSHKHRATHTGYHWVYHSPLINLVAFNYRSSRSREGPKEFLENFKGTLQTDGYAAYNNIFPKMGGEVIMLACMAHARRYFDKARDNDKKRADHVLGLIQRLYAVEATARESELGFEEIKELRQQESNPLLEELKKWLDDNLHCVAPKSAIGKAIAYTLNLWPRLIAYTDDGRYKIDNNPIENTIRPLALGRKNYMFSGSHDAAQRAAMFYSFFGTCKMNDVEPYAWLTDVLNRIPDHKANKLHELLPHNWKPKV